MSGSLPGTVAPCCSVFGHFWYGDFYFIRELRNTRGYSQAELARRSGIPRTAVNAYERITLTAATLARIAEACDCTLAIQKRPRIDDRAAARALEQVLDLTELLPTRRRGALTLRPLPPARS